VTFRTQDGVTLEGRIFGSTDADRGIVLAHMLPADQRSWFPTAEHLASQGYQVLTFNLRGYCPGGEGGCSQGDTNPDAAAVDVRAAVDHLREQGADSIGLAGASVGGLAALLVAVQEDAGVDAVATLSAPRQLGGLAAGPDVLARITGAKVFFAGLNDPAAAADAAEYLGANSPQPATIRIVTTDAHGTDLLTSQHGSAILQELDAFFARYVGDGLTTEG
jgi:pimeloyl-ACP methyl ester carboxylesterase